MSVVAQAKERFSRVEGVVGVGFDGSHVIVYVESEDVKRRIPAVFLGYPVVVKVVGKIGLL